MLKAILFAGVASVIAALPAQAKEWKEIRIATEGAYPPFNFVAADGSLQGLDVEIAEALCKAMDAKCTIVANDWDGMIPGLKSNKFDAVGKTIGAQGSTTQGNYAEDVYGKAGADVKLYPTADEANADLKSGRLDAVVSDKFPISDWIKGDGAGCCKLIGDIPNTQTDTGIALRQGDDDLREQFNAAIKKIRDDGTYATIVKKYFDFDIY
ncbi:transporter substrate-binding domain-containing protein [Brucella intermedia GD04153]|uniref:Transporter substrate-binding domain-containing protein n=1 Tax=Brucella intermedia GD04153 TaxID=2975438 RepID=A0AA42KNU0_9HYPH|nr:transporter substrate-binding domain-containing protein [Brucella intermedia]MDH0126279.1 transporter substrate-binding domain-containing protein [Brucella intermedia GD04153]